MQLPANSNLTLEDLSSGRAYIVGAGPGDDDDNEAAGGGIGGDVASGGQNGAMATQACLVIEGSKDDDNDDMSKSTGMSYALSKVETSNALVMVPPQIPIVPSLGSKTTEEEEEEDDESPSKKQKTDTASNKMELMEMHGQLLEAGGSGASFLDLRPHLLNVGLLRRMLQRTVYDPYDNSRSGGRSGAGGMTIAQLAAALSVSQSQVRHVMTSPSGALSTEAFQLPPRNSGKWGTLSDEAREDASMGIVSVLAECEEYTNAFTADSKVSKAIVIDGFVEEVVRRSAEAEGDGTACLDATVVEHCLRCCSTTEDDDDDDGGSSVGTTLRLDLDRVALILAHHLFNSQTTPWEMSKFEAEWQRLMPCVGQQSKPNIALLAGVALQLSRDQLSPAVIRALADKTNGRKDEGDEGSKGEGGSGAAVNDIYLTYLPEHRLSTSPEKRFELLFREKDSWTADEMEPYIKRLAERGWVVSGGNFDETYFVCGGRQCQGFHEALILNLLAEMDYL